jgi:demethylmenaquinone methyltransferase/2-methoxy-6-polyprenyl-1,4-benzoquinol methylase
MSKQKKQSDSDRYANFGYQKVEKEEKLGLIRDLFDRVASRYDVMNDVMSAGTHRLWKNQMVQWLTPSIGSCHLDVAGGTGDIALRIQNQESINTHVIVCDLSENMLEEGRRRSWDKGVTSGISWVAGDAESLPLNASSVDSYTISFGIRNVTNIEKVLSDAARVLKPGGRFLCLEFCPEQNEAIRNLYDFYSFTIIPIIGQIIAQDSDSYRYLVESIRKFPPPDAFASMIQDAGFGGVSWRQLNCGIAALHSGWRV